MQGFPKVQHVRIGGQMFAQIEGRRYALKEIDGVHYLSEPDLIDLIERYAPPEEKEKLLANVRAFSAQAQGSSGSVQ
jgi:hypothetical protein